jgi:predicted small secreted protein
MIVRSKKMKKLLLILLSAFMLTSCTTTSTDGKKAPTGFGKAFTNMAQLVLSPLQIAAGLVEGISSMPYYLSTSLENINRGMIASNAKVTLDDTYESAYGKRISAVPASGDTGEAFQRMKHASEYFQKVLSRYGVKDAGHYILTSIDTANSKGYTLFAVVYRPSDAIKVIDKYDGVTARTFSNSDRLYYEPFEKDVNGRNVDTIIDWAGMPREFIKTQKAQAVMITMAANSVVNEKKSSEYWDVEKRWISGEFEEITEQKMNAVRNKMKIEN